MSDLVIVDSHHLALEAWANYRAQFKTSPRLFTLDHHTDTSAPMRSFLKKNFFLTETDANSQRDLWLSEVDYKKVETVKNIIKKLSHDEHIVTALKTDILNSALIIAHNAYDTEISVYDEHKIICLGVDRKPFSQSLSVSDCDVVLESHFLEKMVELFDASLAIRNEKKLFDEPYIFDIDLDYLNTFKSVKPKNSTFLKKLATHAGLITIATESEHVRLCALDKDLTADYLLKNLLRLLDR